MFPSRVPILAKPTPENAFTSTWVVPGGDKTLTLPFIDDSNTINFTIDWGDGTTNHITAYNDSDVAHTYAAGGTYTITMDGTVSGFQFDNAGDKTQLTAITKWGSFNMSVPSGFFGCSNLNVTASDAPTISATNLQETFKGCAALTSIGNADGWNTSSVTSMYHMLKDTTNFNQDISSWDTGEVTNMEAMFHSSGFNQDINSWDVAKVTNMSYIFAATSAFDQDISDWNFTAVTEFANFLLSNTAFSTTNYNALLVQIEDSNSQTDKAFHGGDAIPTGAGDTARAALVTRSWTITDGDS